MLEYETDIGAKEIILREIHSTPSITIKDLAKACGLSVAGTNYIDQLKLRGEIRRIGSKWGHRFSCFVGISTRKQSRIGSKGEHREILK